MQHAKPEKQKLPLKIILVNITESRDSRCVQVAEEADKRATGENESFFRNTPSGCEHAVSVFSVPLFVNETAVCQIQSVTDMMSANEKESLTHHCQKKFPNLALSSAGGVL